ncbi:uncharacterized protein LOC113510288 [Galleria mellonella]|uniref:Uncharacterized protein LOC113510288 n=1 Tax=Galleria mellonella TaxID=7137 RepID=A0A6J1WH16_GALME|nr:uncharacterized protein LOC113510288 [Galleria mellonella]
MSLNPLNVLKRKLEDDTATLAKRLCLAKNVISSHHFPTAPKERLIAEWLQHLMKINCLSGEDLRNIIAWLNNADDLTVEFKKNLIQIVSQYLQKNSLKTEDIQSLVSFLEDKKISSQLNTLINEYLHIIITLLQNFRSNETNKVLQEKVFNNLIKYYKDCKKKLEFIDKFLDGENLETIFSYLDTENRNNVISVCENILFPVNRKSFYISYLQTLIRKDNIDELITEKGDNIQSVLKIMDAFFAFPNRRSIKDPKFLRDYIDVFVSCYCKESQLVFAFYIMATNYLNMDQNYLLPVTKLTPVHFDENNEKIKRNLFLNMLDIVLKNEVDINTRLTDTFGEKISKVETKKTSLLFLQAVMMGQLKLEGKPDKTTMQILKTAMKLDPILIEQKMNDILPPLMVMKKNNTNVKEYYIEMLNCLLEILFKLSRGVSFLNLILPNVKNCLEDSNTVQFELKQKLKECEQNDEDYNKIKCKIISGDDVFPQECVEMYGKLTSELMFRQSKELLISLQKDFEVHCLLMLEEGFVSPSIITLTEVIAAILSTYLQNNKMADHTVPENIAQEFWSSFQNFEEECLKKFGECILKLNYNPPLMTSYLRLCLSYSQLKLLNLKYSNTKIKLSDSSTSDVFDLSVLVPCLNNEQWTTLISRIEGDQETILLDKLILTKTIALQTMFNDYEKYNEAITSSKTHLIKELTKNDRVVKKSLAKVISSNLDKNQLKMLSKHLVKLCLNDTGNDIFTNESIANNKQLLDAMVVETCKIIANNIENADLLAKSLKKLDFNLVNFAKDHNMTEYFNPLTYNGDNTVLINCVDVLKQLKIYYLDEKYQLLAIYMMLVLKKCGQKKLRRNVDHVLRSIFELSPQTPDLYKIFPIETIFSFEDKIVFALLTLKIKTSNHFLIIKSIIESAVKRVRTESDLVKNIVELILKRHNPDNIKSIEYFANPAFQMTCIILPLIVKQKKAITASAFRSILADLQEKLHKYLLDSFKNINFNETTNMFNASTGNTDESVAVSESTMATLNAMAAYSITLSKYSETTDAKEIINLDCLWSGLEYFVQNAINTIQNQESTIQHVESSIQLLNVVLRYIKKLESHYIFETRDKLFLQIWQSVKSRLFMIYGNNKHKNINNGCIEDIGVTLKFLCEVSSVECFLNDFVGELNKLTILEKLPQKAKEAELNELLTTGEVSKYMWTNCLKANIVGPKCVAMSKLMFNACKSAKLCIWQHYETEQYCVNIKSKKKKFIIDVQDEDTEVKILKVENSTCEVLKLFLDTLSEAILAAKKITLDYKFIDSVFELQHLIQFVMGCKTTKIKCEVSWQAFFKLFEGSVSILNSLLVSREELLEDRWPCFMQCYRALVRSLCEKCTSKEDLERSTEEKLAETAHSIEKLTQSISRRKVHVSRIAAYTVADICSTIENTVPPRLLRQHLENTVSLLIQVSDTNYSVAFLRRALAGHAGQMTMTNLYTMYKRYNKYVGNA